MFVFTLITIGGLLLLFKSTRLTGVAGLTLLSLVYPPLFLGLLLIGSIAIYIIHYQKGKNYERTKLPTRRHQ